MNISLKSKLSWIGIVLFTIYYLVYLYVTTVNIAWQTWFFHLQLVDSFFSGTLVFKDLLTRYGEHGLLGYNIIFIANAVFFHLNTLVDVYIHLFLILLSAIAIYLVYKKNISPNDSSYCSNLLFWIIAFTMFSVSQQAAGGMDTQVRLGIYSFLLATILIDRYYFDKIKNNIKLIIIFIMLILSVNVFGTFYSLAWVPGIYMLIGIFMYSNKKLDAKFISIGALLFILWIIYIKMYSLFIPASENSTGILQGIINIFLHPLKSTMFLLAFMCSSLLGRTLWQDYHFPQTLELFGGVIVLFIYIYCFFGFFKAEMWKRTFLPILLMFYSIGVMILVLIGRNQMDWEGGTNYWYAAHIKFGIIGCIWVLLYNHFNIRKIKWNSIPFFILMIIIVFQIISNIADWKRAPHVRAYFTSMIPFALDPTNMPIDKNGITPLINTLPETIHGLDIMKKYNLNIYYDSQKNFVYKNGNVLLNGQVSEGVLGPGWYQPEQDSVWISKRASITFRSGSKGDLKVKGYLPNFLSPNTIILKINDKIIYQGDHSGTFEIQKNIDMNTIITLDIELSDSVIPKDKGLNQDMRELGAIINNINTN